MKINAWLDYARWRFWRFVYRLSKIALAKSQRELNIVEPATNSRYRWHKR